MQLVVVMAVRKAVSAATTTFTAISMNRFFIDYTPLLALRCGLLSDPVVERSDLLDVHLLRGILLLGRQVDLLLYAVGGEGALVLEGYRGDLVLSGALGLEADVDTLDVGVRIPLTLQQGCLGDTLLGRLYGGNEGAQTVDLDGVGQ